MQFDGSDWVSPSFPWVFDGFSMGLTGFDWVLMCFYSVLPSFVLGFSFIF